MGHLLHLMFRCDGDVMESDVFWGFLVDLNGANLKFSELVFALPSRGFHINARPRRQREASFPMRCDAVAAIPKRKNSRACSKKKERIPGKK